MEGDRHLSEELVNWMKELAESKRLVVRAHLGYHTLALAVPRHLQQLKVFIKELVKKYGALEDENGLANAIGLSLTQAYEKYPEAVLDLLEEWFQSWKKPISRLIRREFAEALKIRKSWANVIAITLREIRLSEQLSLELSGRIFNYLLELLRAKQKSTRQIAIQALCKRIKENFSTFSEALKESAKRLHQDDRTSVVEAMTAVYLQQRKALSVHTGEDLWYTHKEENYVK